MGVASLNFRVVLFLTSFQALHVSLSARTGLNISIYSTLFP